MGYIGTQSDKVADAIETFVSLVDSMPEFPERMEVLRTALLQNEQISKPGFRNKSRVYDYWREMGYNDDPARTEVEQIKNLTWEQVMSYYKTYIQNKPLTIIVMGDQKKIDQKRLTAKFGKIQKVAKSKLFAPLVLDF